MRQWFQGRLEGHYVGRARQAAGGVHVPGGKHYTIEIYRAVVSEITLLARTDDPKAPQPHADADQSEGGIPPEVTPPRSLPEEPEQHHHEFDGEALYQALITEVQFESALGPGRTVRGSAHDVVASQLIFTHPAEHKGEAYGHIEAVVSGWFRPPPEQDVPEEIAPPRERAVVWRSEEISGNAAERPQGASSPASTQPRAGGVSTAAQDDLFGDEPDDEDAPLRAAEDQPDRPLDADWPFFTIGHLTTLALMFGADVGGGLLFYLCYIPALGLRRWLRGVVPDGWLTQGIAMSLMIGEALLAALTVAGFHEAGCTHLGAGRLTLLVGGVLMSSLLPRPLPFAVCLAALAAVLGQFYGSALTMCGP